MSRHAIRSFARISSRATPLVALLAAASAISAARAADAPRQTVNFDLGWKFHLGETDPTTPQTAANGWRDVNLPHDYSIEGPAVHYPATAGGGGRGGRGRAGGGPPAMFGPFDRNSPAGGGGGWLNAGPAWYSKTFTPPADSAKRTSIQFDGVYMDSRIFLNDTQIAAHPYGYTSFSIDLTDKLKPGQPNTITVHTNVQQPSQRWYSGAGIYRHVWLTTTDPIHVAHWGTYITTPQVTEASATIAVKTSLQNESPADADVSLTTRILDPDGKEVAKLETTGHAAASPQVNGEPTQTLFTVPQTLIIPNPHLWSTETPVLYTAVSEVRSAGKLVDSTSTPFGIRSIEFTPDNGFLLNGKRLQIYGVCDHHDLGCLGSAAYRRAIERQLEILKSMGCNGIRTSHNPPSPELLELCDQMGFVVMDEAFDEWLQSKTTFGYGRFFNENSEADITSMVMRDRNHPSVVMWSIGNEIPEQGSANGGEMAKCLADIVKRNDSTRFIVSAQNNPGNALRTGFSDALDVFGINYNIADYPAEHNRQIQSGVRKPIIGTETASDVSTRGDYNLIMDSYGKLRVIKEFDNQVTSYDTDYPGWATSAEMEFNALRGPWVTGEFVWTGFDYIGEPTPMPWPARSSYFGIIDLAGFPKDRFYLYQSQWTKKPMVHILPHWNWPQFAGAEIPVWTYSNGDSVELFLNGKSLGEKKFADTRAFHLEWKVPFAPGKLEAVAKKGGVEIARDVVETAGKPAKIILTPDRTQIHADGVDLSFVKASLVDDAGRPCPNADDEISFALTGPGAIVGTDNGDPINQEFFQDHQHKAFHGLALAVVRATDQPGALQLTATAEGLPPTIASITTANP